MSTVHSSPPPTSPPVTNTQGLSTAIVVKSTPSLQAALQDQTVKATVTSTPAANQVQVQTAFGPITLQSSMTLAKGSTLTMVLTNLSPPIFQIGAVDGKAVPGALTQTQAKAAGLPSPSPALQNASQPLQTGTKLSAVLLRPATLTVAAQAPTAPQMQVAAPQTSAPVQAALQPQGQATQAQSSTTSTPQASPAGAPQTQPASASQSAQATAATSTVVGGKSVQGAIVTTLPSGTRFTVTLVRIETPGSVLNPQPTAAPKSIAQGQSVTGTVIGRTPQGQPIVQTPNATVSLNTQSALANGSKVTLRFETPPTVAEPSTAAQRLGRAGMGMGMVNAKGWDDLSEAFKTLIGADPARFQSVAQNTPPQPGPKLNNQMLFFLNALKGGDVKNLFGDTAHRILTKERPALMTRLGADFQTMAAMSDEPQSGDWKLSLIPLWNGERLDQIRFYHRGKNEDDEENGDEEGTRFVLDIELSNLGRLQIDGLLSATKTRLDLILRTETPLPEDMRIDIGKIAQTAEDLLGLSASVSFQARPEDFVEFPPNAPPQQGLFA
ncbi:MAG: hypothetical protein COB46_08720 [Rhodospirillaceae bacterium]|nr:MAG: hypothetical protein COB46_08720 [Rhodospirillaceae bacterium]